MTTSAFTNPFRTFFSITSSTTQKHNRNLKIFLPSERPHASTLDAKFSIYVASDRELVAPRCLRLNESCWPKILYRKNYGDKKGVNHSNNKERCSAGNLDDLLWKYCKSRYADFWRMCNALRLGREVCNWYWLAISSIWRRRSTNV